MAVTPFLQLFLPEMTSRVDETIAGLNAAMTSIDTWAEANQGGAGGSYGEPLAAMRVVDATTPLDPDGNVLVQPTDGTLLVDAGGGGLFISFPDSPTGTAWRVIRTDDGSSGNPVVLTTPNSSSAMFQNAHAGGGDLTRLSAGEAVTAESDGTNWWLTDAVGAPAAAGQVRSVSGDYTVLLGDRYVLVDASAGLVTITLPVNFDPGSVVTVIRTDEVDADGTQVAVTENGGSNAINGRSPFTIFARGAFEFVFDGFDWHGSSSPFDFTAIGPMDTTTGTYIPQLQPPGFGPRGWHLDALRLQQLAEMSAFSPSDGQVLFWDAGQNAWSVRTLPPAGATHLDDLLDVQIGTLNDQDLLRYNGTDGQWEDVSAADLGFPSPMGVQPSLGPSANNSWDFTPGTGSTLSVGSPMLFLLDATATQANIKLPHAADSITADFKSVVVTFKKVDGSPNIVHVTPQTGETIDGADHIDISTQWASLTFATDGTNWFVI